MGRGKEGGDAGNRRENTLRTRYATDTCGLGICFPSGGSFLSKPLCVSISCTGVSVTENNYPLLHTRCMLSVLNMLLLIHVTILRSRKCHRADFIEEETQTQTIKGLPRMPETVICYSWNLVPSVLALLLCGPCNLE